MPQITFTIVQHSYHFEIFDDMPMGICVYKDTDHSTRVNFDYNKGTFT